MLKVYVSCMTRGVWGHAPPGIFFINCMLWDYFWGHFAVEPSIAT